MPRSRDAGEGKARTSRAGAPKPASRAASSAPKRSKAGADPMAIARKAIADATAALGQAISEGVDDAVSQANFEASAATARGLRATIRALEQATAKLAPSSTNSTREELLAAAATAFAAKGFDGVSVADIAESAGFTKGAVYSQFGSKEALFFEVVEARISQPVCDVEGLESALAWDEMRRRIQTVPSGELDSKQFLLALEAIIFGLRHPEASERMAALFDDIIDRLAQLYFDASDAQARQKAIALMMAGDMVSMFAVLGVRDAGPEAITRAIDAIRSS